jgi:hypothetical protein
MVRNEPFVCPKCGMRQRRGPECIKCGVIFEKLHAAAARPDGVQPPRPVTSPPAATRVDARRTFRAVRIFILVLFLLLAGSATLYSRLRTTEWNDPLEVIIYPVNADNSPVTADYIADLDATAYLPIEDFMSDEAVHFDLPLNQVLKIEVAPELKRAPPDLPSHSSLLGRIWWSLKIRLYAFRHSPYLGPSDTVQVFVLYHDPERNRRLNRSLGLEKGLVAVVNAYADPDMADRNNVVIVHELLHTLGATDKYDPATEAPVFPIGYADPDKEPLYPQETAEIMAGSIPVSDDRWVMARGLYETAIGRQTAEEINWRD